MGTIRKQSILSSLFIYIGFAIGAINILFLFPKYFTPEEFGLTRILVDIALILSTVCTAGAIPIGFKFYPYYSSTLPDKKNELPAIVLGIVLLSCLAIVVCFPYLQPIIIRKFGARSPFLVTYLDLVIPLTLSLALFGVLEVFAWISGKTVLSNFTKELLFRSLVLILILLWINGFFLDFTQWIRAYSFVYFPLVLILGIAVLLTRKFYLSLSISALSRRLGPMMFKYGGAYFLSALLNIVAKTNDTLIIASQSIGGLADAAIFTIATYLITVMDVPQRSLISAATPQIAKAWRDKDLGKLDRLYKKTALNLLIIAAGILGLILINTPLLIKILGPNYSPLLLLMLILGIAKLIDLGTGLNSQILQLSKHWRIDLLTNMFFVGVSILLNYLLTRKYGIIGTAIGSLVAIVLFNLIRFICIKRIYKLQPFSSKNGTALLIAMGMLILTYWLPIPGIWVSSILKSILFLGGFVFLILRMNISPDITELWVMAKNKLKA
jgi:O-antigen/teichoic acid export membrane protein